jgi:predicted ATP-binding protein involved in virulence
MKRIKEICVKNLFGIFYHDLVLNMDERVTIIHSPNGFGKTAILKLLNELFTQGTNVLEATPFDEFHIYFEDLTHFWIKKTIRDAAIPDSSENVFRKNIRPQIKFYYSNPDGKSIFSLGLTERGSSAEKLRADLQYTQHLLQEARRVGDEQVIEQYELRAHTMEMRFLEEVRFLEEMNAIELEEGKLATERILKGTSKEERRRLQELRQSIPIRFIETQRLLNSTTEAGSPRTTKRLAMLPAVTLYSEELSKRIIAKLADSTTLSQSLDRTFPQRLVELATRQSDIAESELREKLAELEEKRKSLMAVGLVDQNANDAVLAANRIDANTKAVLSLYIEDTQQKLAVFDDIAPKLDLLTRIINKRFLYKEMSISRKDGFVFTTLNGTRLPLENLSSGEQHELVLFYELLLKTLPGSLIMIDEPEISLHVVWQEQFLQDVQDITRLAEVDVLIATHSPDIIDGRRDLVVELEGPKDGGL